MSWQLRAPERGERGSIPIALLVTIMMGGLLAALLSRTVAEQRSTRFDGEYTGAVHAAEVGLNDALFRFNNSMVLGTGTQSGSGTSNGYAYQWSATFQPTTRFWQVVATGRGATGLQRTVRADIRDEPIFDLSLATHLNIEFGGGNYADSYRSHTNPQSRCSTTANPACYGAIASNGNINFGSSGATNSYADQVRVHDWGRNPGPHRCSSPNYCVAPFRHNINEELDIGEQIDLVNAMESACPSFPNWRASATPITGSGTNAHATLGTGSGAPATVLWNNAVFNIRCFGTVEFDRNTEVATAFTRTTPFLMFVKDRIQIDGAVRINCLACGNSFPPAGSMPIARRLQIFTPAKDTGSGNNLVAGVQIRQHAKIGGAIYAPEASCGNLQSNAQVEIFGSLVCLSILNQGGWAFHYDEDLLDGLSTQRYHVADWTEDRPGG